MKEKYFNNLIIIESLSMFFSSSKKLLKSQSFEAEVILSFGSFSLNLFPQRAKHKINSVINPQNDGITVVIHSVRCSYV